MKTDRNPPDIESPELLRLSEIIEKRHLIYLTCPDCGRSSITNGYLIPNQDGDPTFGELIKNLRCERDGGCGRQGLKGRLEELPDS